MIALSPKKAYGAAIESFRRILATRTRTGAGRTLELARVFFFKAITKMLSAISASPGRGLLRPR
jgi:hypothetical protein